MPCFRCDFEVHSEFCLPADQPEFRATLASGHELIIRNDPVDEAGNVPTLTCSIVGEADELDGTHTTFREYLVEYFDVLTLVTQAAFMVEKPRRLMEWESGSRERMMKIFETWPISYPPEPSLVPEFAHTVSELERAGISAPTKVALKYYRYGFLERSPEDQFVRFWLALEVIAESKKPKEVIAVPCADCGTAMKCATCGSEPHRRPMANDAIRMLIREITKGQADAVIKRQFAARNGIMHGRSVDSIEADCKMGMDRLVSELGAVTWQAIANSISLKTDGEEIVFGYRQDFAKKTLVVAMIGGFEHLEDTPHPAEDRLPTAKITLQGRFEPDPS